MNFREGYINEKKDLNYSKTYTYLEEKKNLKKSSERKAYHKIQNNSEILLDVFDNHNLNYRSPEEIERISNTLNSRKKDSIEVNSINIRYGYNDKNDLVQIIPSKNVVNDFDPFIIQENEMIKEIEKYKEDIYINKNKELKKQYEDNNNKQFSYANYLRTLDKNKKKGNSNIIKEKKKNTEKIQSLIFSNKKIKNNFNEKKLKKKQKKENKKHPGEINLKKFKIEDFEIGMKLGKGRFGDVYLARELKSNYIVALKILKKTEIQRLGAEKLVVREINIHSFLDHKNIIKLYGFFHDDNNIYLILEYAPDGELYKELKNTVK